MLYPDSPNLSKMTFLLFQVTWSIGFNNPKMVHLIHKAKNNSSKSHYTWKMDQLRRKGRLVIGKDDKLRSKLLHLYHNTHEGGHSGTAATMKRLGLVVY